MTEEQFWQIIQRSFDASGGDIDDQADALTDELEPLPVDEIESFDRIFNEKSVAAYSWDLWGAAYIINGGCSNDGFCYFRWWLISRGKEWYETVVKNADTLADYPEDLEVAGSEFEEIAYVARQVCEEKAGDMAESGPKHPSEPTGEPFDEDNDEEFQRRWPKLCEKYWLQ